MGNLLIIDANPKKDVKTSFSKRVSIQFLKEYREFNGEDRVETIELYHDDIPVVDDVVLTARGKLASGESLTQHESTVVNRMDQILQQFKKATKYVIVLPLFNFNIPSKLKDYLDNVVIARETFKFTENGVVGLLNDGRKVLVIQGSGGVYTNNDWYTDAEYSHKYLQFIFSFFGVTDYTIVRAQGTSYLDKDKVISNAFEEVRKAAAHFAAN
jgi:FMN-dependent NADH-azoreductase